jgi:succinoglycan biosynthesis protein ExoA
LDFGTNRKFPTQTIDMSDTQSVQVSIVVACRNEIRHISAFLDSLLAQNMGGVSWEAIIADGMSSDGTREILDRYCARRPNLRVIANPGRIVSIGLNAAIRSARGTVILRMDAHTSYSPDYCIRCVETLESTGAQNVGGPARTRAQGVRARAIAAAYHSRFSTGGAHFHNPDYEGWVDTVPYGCWRKATLESIGLFDEDLIRNQDDELNLRLHRRGGKIWQNPAILSWYSTRATLSGLFHQYFQYGFWKVAVIRKHRTPGAWRQLVPAGFLFANIALLATMLFAATGGAVSTLSAAAAYWLTMASVYAVASVTASVLAARRHGWITLPYLPAIFAIYHFSYGLGFAAGLLWFCSKPSWRFSADSVFARITR